MVYVAAVQAITTLIIGLFAGYMAWRQWRTSQDWLVLDLFEKRFQVFQELTRTTAASFQRVNVQISDLANFDAATEKARFLFGAAANHGNLPDQLDEGVGAMPQINLPHVLHTFDTTCDRGRRILNVATDLAANPTAPGYAEALDDLKRALGKLIDRRKGYDQIVLLHFSPVVA